MRIGSLFAGIGGFDLAARWMGWETAWFSEIDPYASSVLAKHWPGVPNHGDITKIDFTQVEPVDMLCGGFPCQDISNAGKREGIDGERSGLWREYARAIRELRPRYVVVENVAALLARGMGTVLGDLSEVGYDAEWAVLSANDVGAPQLRERVWIVAYPIGVRELQPKGSEPYERRRPSDSGEALDDANGGRLGRVYGWHDHARWRSLPAEGHTSVVNAARVGRIERWPQSVFRGGWFTATGTGGGAWGDGEWREGRDGTVRLIKPGLRVLAHGVSRRVDQLRGLGNAIVPQCALEIFRAIEAREAELRRAA